MLKFENVDVLDSLEKIMKTHTESYQSDFEYDKRIIREALQSNAVEDRNLLWLSRLHGTHCLYERDVFIKDTPANITWKQISLSGSSAAILLCDKSWLVQAIENIVKNSLDHTDAGGRICIEWNHLPSVLQITVKDNGSGIHPEDIHHIFKRFYRSRFSKDTQGIGLGLPLAKAIIEAHDGSIEVNSEVGTGTVFIINFLIPTKL